MKILEKIILTIFFYPMFVVLGVLYGLIIVPIDMIDGVILHPHEEWSEKDE